MEYALNKYADCRPATACDSPLRQPTTRERLLEQKKYLNEKLSLVNAALEALDKSPEFEALNDLLMKVF
jgi:hypothetical protein